MNVRVRAVACILAMGMATTAMGDTVTTSDGSRIVGTIKQIYDGKVTIETAIAGELVIEASQVVSITSDSTVNVRLQSGDTLVGAVSESGDNIVVSSEVGNVSADAGNIVSLWPEGAEDPDEAAEIAKYKPNWSAHIEAGASRTEGNTDTLLGRGIFSLKRETSFDVLEFYAGFEYSEQNDVRNTNEYYGGINFQHNLTERWFWYSQLRLEYDEFEQLDIRADWTIGTGYYVLKKPDHEWKIRAGVGYRHETYDTGQTNDDVTLDVGWDYRVDINPWLQFTQSSTYRPSFERFSDYRLLFDTAFTVPLKNDMWKFKIGMRNMYNSMPVAGLERLDNIYYANIVVDFE